MSAPRVLIVSASAGSGHVRAGDALLTAFRAADAEAEHVDVLQLAPRWVRAAYAGGFELIASRAPRVWRQIYERSDGPDSDAARWGGVAASLLFREFRALLLVGGFDFCVCTHFLPAQLAARREGLPPFATVITDHAVHRYWVQRRVHSYFVANRPMADALRQRLPRALVEVTGIPVDPALGSPWEQRAARPSLQLDADRPVVLVMGGGFGLGVEAAANAVLAARTPGLQVLVVCGRNAEAQRRLAQAGAGSSDASRTLRIAGFVNDIGRFMAAADVIVTKPGGLTTSEALALSRPLLLTRGMPGHEEANVRFLSSVGAALATPTRAAVSAGVERFFDDARLRASLGSSAALAATPFAARHIAHAMLNRLAARAAA
jgi:processive 1,2-diacylglycerol beta-glucosyltransferase